MRFSSVLFLCVANAARSQLAEALARARFGGSVRVQSAGSAPGAVHPHALTVLAERGVSTEGLVSKHVQTIDPASVDLVITLCAEEQCPLFLGDAPRISWAMPDPDRKGEVLDEAEQLAHFRVACDVIAAKIDALAAEHGGDDGRLA